MSTPFHCNLLLQVFQKLHGSREMATAEGVLGVETTGPLLASLLFQQSAVEGDQEGFLIGEWRKRRTDEINDTHMRATREDVTLDIHALLPSTKMHQFYNNFGDVSENSLLQILGHKYKNVIGWYRFRRNTCLEALLLERIIHQKLASSLTPPQMFFVFAIFTSTTSANTSVHTFDHTFLRFVDGKFESIPLSIINLGNTSHVEYKRQSRPAISKYLQQFSTPQSESGASESSIGKIQLIHQTLQANLQRMNRQVLDTEASIQQYLMDIAAMQDKLNQKPPEAHKEISVKALPQLENEKPDLLVASITNPTLGLFIVGSEQETSHNQTGRSGDDQRQAPSTS